MGKFGVCTDNTRLGTKEAAFDIYIGFDKFSPDRGP